MANPKTIEQLYSPFLKEYRCAGENGTEKLKKLEKELRDHPNYLKFYPHKEYLYDVPQKVVLDYFVYLSVHGYIGDNVTLSFLRKVMRDYVMNLHVLDLDLRQIIDDGWEHHLLEDSDPRGAICHDIEVFFDDLLE